MVALLASCARGFGSPAWSDGPWRGLAERISAASVPDSTAVLVLFDDDVIEGLRSQLPRSFRIVPFRYADLSHDEAVAPQQLGQMYGETSLALERFTDVWVVGRPSETPGKVRAARFAEMAASTIRKRVLLDTANAPGVTGSSVGGWIAPEAWRSA